MVFDGAAYYGLPTAAQASSSGPVQHAAPVSAKTANNHGIAHNAGNAAHNHRQASRGIIQRPYSYEASPSMYYAGTQASQAHQRPWHGQTPLHGQMWQHQPFQPYSLNIPQGQPPAQYAPAPPLPPGPPPRAPPPPLRHALPPKPQTTFLPPNDARPTSIQSAEAKALPAVLKPMRPAIEQHSPDYRAQRVAQPDISYTPGQAHPSAPAKLFCEICKLRFHSTIHLIAHQRNEHVKCCKHDEGCMFEGLPDVVELHEQDRHLVFRPGARREKTRPDGPPGAKIQGTNISLETEEDIAKWIEERKRKWPGNKNTELRLQRELKRKAYEAASPAVTNSSSRSGKKAKTGKAGSAAQHPDGYQRAPRIWGQTLPESSETQEVTNSAAADSSDDECAAADVEALLTQSSKQVYAEKGFPPTAISRGTEFDGKLEPVNPTRSADGTRPNKPVPAEPSHLAEMEEQSDHDSAPEQVAYGKESGADEEEQAGEDAPDQVHDTLQAHKRPERTRPSCNAWTTLGTCKFGKQCRYEHDPARRGRVRHEPPQAPKNPFERGDLIGKLVHHQIRHEISDLTQVIDFLARNNWLKHVELYPGQKAEAEGRINEVGS